MPLRKKIFLSLLMALLLLGLMLWPRQQRESCKVPVLLYHHFAAEATADTVVSSTRFREQMTALKEAGFTAVTLQQLVDYVERGRSLPEKPVLITMDDGYTSNLTIAAPILDELGLHAAVFVIGVNEGREVYLHSGEPLYPTRFSYEEAAPWVEKGTLDLQCHSWDMHQLASYGFSGREGMLPLPEETAQAYQRALQTDLETFRQRRGSRVSTALCAIAYPYGYYTEALDQYLGELGVPVTFTTVEQCSRLRRGDPASLRMLGRFNVTEAWDGKALVKRLERASIDIPFFF